MTENVQNVYIILYYIILYYIILYYIIIISKSNRVKINKLMKMIKLR